MLASLFLSRWGTYIVMLAVLGVIILILRGLFGPKGLLRDPYWDKRNQEIRAEEAAAREARLRVWREQNGLSEDDTKFAEVAKKPDAVEPEKTAGANAGKRHREGNNEH